MTVRARPLAALALAASALGVAGIAGVSASDDATTATAEFTSARGLVERAEVRLGGAPAGSVERIALTDRGTARVTLRLHDGLPSLRRDATAAIRPVDLLGDVYVELSPGGAAEPLDGPIPVARTSNAPRLDELLATFDDPTRAGLRALLAESGRALGGRGGELGRAAIALRPALEAADGVLDELADQNAALGDLVVDTERAVTGLARRDDDVRGAIGGLDRLLAATDRRRTELDRGVAGLPALLRRARSTSRRLAATAATARPLAADLGAAAPPLAAALDELPPFTAGLRRAAGDLGPTLAALRGTLTDGAPALRSLAAGLGSFTAIAPELDGLLAIVQRAAPAISEGFFVNFADQGAEPGTQPFDPFTDPRRTYWRGAAVLSCEAFGVPVRPGCLADVPGAAAADRGTRRSRRSPGTTGRPTPQAAAPTPAPAPSERPRVPGTLLPEVQRALEDTLAPTRRGTGDLLDFLLGR